MTRGREAFPGCALGPSVGDLAAQDGSVSSFNKSDSERVFLERSSPLRMLNELLRVFKVDHIFKTKSGGRYTSPQKVTSFFCKERREWQETVRMKTTSFLEKILSMAST